MGYRAFEIAIAILERALAALLLVLILFALIGLGVDAVKEIAGHGYLAMEDLLHLIEHALTLFILIELFAIAMAYLRSRQIIKTVLEASLVAVARKMIAFEPSDASWARGLTLAALFVAVAFAWWLLRRRGVGAGAGKVPRRDI